MRGSLLDLLAYGALRGVEALLLSVGPEVAEAAARGAGRLWYRMDRSRRTAALDNLRVAFGDALAPRERDRIARRSFEHAFLVAVEVIRRPRVLSRARHAHRLGRYVGDHERLLAEAREGKPGLVLTGHVGNWELAGMAVRLEGVPFAGVARPIENPYVDDYVSRTRGGPDALIQKRGAVRAITRALKEGRWVGIVADQNAGRHGEFVPFFGLAASTYPLAATLAVRHDVPVYFGAAIRRGSALRYDYLTERYEPPPGTDDRGAPRAMIEAFNRWLERLIRAHPDQYFWLHRRWRTRPEGEGDDPRLPGYVRRRAPSSARDDADDEASTG
jgi:KDO2-lipid IV(A) lauroyltransferase